MAENATIWSSGMPPVVQTWWMHSVAPGMNDLRNPRTHLGQIGEPHAVSLRHFLSLRPALLVARRPGLRSLTNLALRSRACFGVSKRGKIRLSLSFCLLTAFLFTCSNSAYSSIYRLSSQRFTVFVNLRE